MVFIIAAWTLLIQATISYAKAIMIKFIKSDTVTAGCRNTIMPTSNTGDETIRTTSTFPSFLPDDFPLLA